MQNYNPESKTEKVSERFPNLVNLVQKTLRHRVVQWMRNAKEFEEKFKKVKITEDQPQAQGRNEVQLEDERSFERYLNKMVKII
jgi:hypothetical protein